MHASPHLRVCVIVGTRPEAIKLAPVILRLRDAAGAVCTVVNTGQHREMCAQALDAFNIKADFDLDAMVAGQNLSRLTARLFEKIDALLENASFDGLIVQGDTTSAMVGAMVAFYRRISIAHIEAGLRTYNRWAPFPEEINRTVISHLADRHFSPTLKAANNLIRAGVDRNRILVTGNTVIDAVNILKPKVAARQLGCVLPPKAADQASTGRLVLVTSHRRESLGAGLEGICQALIELVDRYSDLVIVYPLHLNPKVREPAQRILGGHPRIHLVQPMSYLDLITLIVHCTLILTDSGGIQEEAPSFGKPILILRDVTERPEVIEAGAARIVGASREIIVLNASELLENPILYARMASANNPFGDGRASERIVENLTECWGRAPAPPPMATSDA
jgi:UDP-N-acetylglucosamine 2-epimerase (non-hydrolysing)